ncbi:MAG TPA: NYN domain-containing protein [Acidimicrobiia bacterium]
MDNDEERIALFLDYENLAIGAEEQLHLERLDFGPIADALAERGRVVVRRAYADWARFEEGRRELTRHNIELIEIPQRMGSVRKNAADIKMAVDAVELCFEREYITTYVLGTGDSDFTPLVHKLRELNRRVIGIGVEASTSALLPGACDEFLFYERLDGVDLDRTRRATKSTRAKKTTRAADVAAEAEAEAEQALRSHGDGDDEGALSALVARTLAGLQRTAGGPVLASQLKRALLRKDPTFSETTYGFRSFGELLRHLEARHAVSVGAAGATGDPEVALHAGAGAEQDSFEHLREVVSKLTRKSGPPHLSGLKTQLRKVDPDFSEKRFGYGGFLQFCKAARARGVIEMEWNTEADDYVVRPGGASAPES